MKKNLLLIIGIASVLFSSSGRAYWADLPTCDQKQYSCYTEFTNYCKNLDLPNMSKKDLGNTSKCPYGEFTALGITSTITCMQSSENSGDATGYKDGITLEEIGDFSWFRAAEVSRRLYRKNMNTIFSCAIIASRLEKLEKLEKIIKEKKVNDEIGESLEKERKKYDLLMSNMKCVKNEDTASDTKVVDTLAKSAMVEYCKYTYYLDYLDKNIKNDFSSTLKEDQKIGPENSTESSGSVPSMTLDGAANLIASYTNTLDSERARANDTLPKAIMAYKEMDRTYITHLLLVIIYSDYVKLRDNLNTYMSIVSQTFEKAFNAQDANKR